MDKTDVNKYIRGNLSKFVFSKWLIIPVILDLVEYSIKNHD